MMECICS